MEPHSRSYYNSVGLTFCPLMPAAAPAELSVLSSASKGSAPLGEHQDVLVGVFNPAGGDLGMFPMLSVPIATTSSSSAAGSSGAGAGSRASSSAYARTSADATNAAATAGGVSSGSSMLTKAIGSFW
jgi:hypothetical protein